MHLCEVFSDGRFRRRGTIQVQSEPGKGSVFTVELELYIIEKEAPERFTESASDEYGLIFMDAHIAKPVRPDKLKDTIEQVFDKRKQQKMSKGEDES